MNYRRSDHLPAREETPRPPSGSPDSYPSFPSDNLGLAVHTTPRPFPVNESSFVNNSPVVGMDVPSRMRPFTPNPSSLFRKSAAGKEPFNPPHLDENLRALSEMLRRA